MKHSEEYFRGAVEAGKDIERMAAETGYKAKTVYCKLSHYRLLGDYRERHPLIKNLSSRQVNYDGL